MLKPFEIYILFTGFHIAICESRVFTEKPSTIFFSVEILFKNPGFANLSNSFIYLIVGADYGNMNPV